MRPDEIGRSLLKELTIAREMEHGAMRQQQLAVAKAKEVKEQIRLFVIKEAGLSESAKVDVSPTGVANVTENGIRKVYANIQGKWKKVGPLTNNVHDAVTDALNIMV